MGTEQRGWSENTKKRFATGQRWRRQFVEDLGLVITLRGRRCSQHEAVLRRRAPFWNACGAAQTTRATSAHAGAQIFFGVDARTRLRRANATATLYCCRA